jgi:hypothetical protein
MYRATDPWDQRFLGEAMDLDRSLQPLGDGYTDYLPAGQGRSVAFYTTVFPRLADEVGFDATLLADPRAPGDTLIGAAIAQLGEAGSFADRWNDVFAFHQDGATWGLVALDQSVHADPLLDAVRRAIAGSPLDFNDQADDELASPPTTAPPPNPVTDSGSGTDGGPGTTEGSTPSTTSSTAPPVSVPPPPVPITVPSSPLDPVLDPVVDLVNGLVGGLLGGGS